MHPSRPIILEGDALHAARRALAIFMFDRADRAGGSAAGTGPDAERLRRLIAEVGWFGAVRERVEVDPDGARQLGRALRAAIRVAAGAAQREVGDPGAERCDHPVDPGVFATLSSLSRLALDLWGNGWESVQTDRPGSDGSPLDLLEGGLILVDGHGVIAGASAGFCRLVGEDRSSVIGRGIDDFLVAPGNRGVRRLLHRLSDDRDAAADMLLTTGATRTAAQRVRLRARRPAGMPDMFVAGVAADPRGTPADRQAASFAEALTAIADDIPITLFHLDEAWRFAWATPMRGPLPGEVRGSDARERIHPDDLPRVRRAAEAAAAERRPFATRLRGGPPGGPYEELLVVATPRWAGDGGFDGWAGLSFTAPDNAVLAEALRPLEDGRPDTPRTAGTAGTDAASGVGTIVIDPAGRVVGATRPAGRLLGLGAHRLDERDWPGLVGAWSTPEGPLGRADWPCRKAQLTGRSASHAALRAASPEAAWVRVAATPLASDPSAPAPHAVLVTLEERPM